MLNFVKVRGKIGGGGGFEPLIPFVKPKFRKSILVLLVMLSSVVAGELAP